MEQTTVIHIIDPASARRAALAMMAHKIGYHAEIFENIDELLAMRVAGTRVLLAGLDSDIPRLVAGLAQSGALPPIIAVAENPTIADVVAAMKAGASDFLVLPATPQAIAELVGRYEWLARHSANTAPLAVARQRLASLSPRERDVLAAIADGLSNKRIAHELALSPRTVEQHRASAMAKLGACHVAEALRLYWSAGSSLPLTAPDAEPSALASSGAEL